MSIKTHRFAPLTRINAIFVLFAVVAYPAVANGSDSRKLDESTADGQGSVKCQPSCVPTPPSPPPPAPCPPPPELPPPPPPPKKPPTTPNCPPPPSPPSPLYIYISGPPGNLYPIDSDFSGADSNKKIFAEFLLVIGFGILGLLAFW